MNEVSQRQCPQGTMSHTIKEGDNLYDLAQRHDTTVQAITMVNVDLDPDRLEIGQIICIPGGGTLPLCPGRRYTIKAGDTLGNIAVRFNTTVNEILRLNPGIDPRSLRVAQIICIPVITPPSRCPEGYTPYIIKQGDTLYTILQKFGAVIDDIISANQGINPDRLVIGDRICIPRTRGTQVESQQLSENVSDQETEKYTMENEEENIMKED